MAAYRNLQKIISVNKKIKHPPGLSYISNYLPDYILDKTINTIDQQQWVQEIFRRQQHYGLTYYHTRHPLQNLQPIQQKQNFINDMQLLKLITDKLVADGIFQQNEINQVLVNEYKGNHGISLHIEDQQDFGDKIVGLSLLNPSNFTLQYQDDIDKRFTMYLEPNSLYILEGEAREIWKHGILREKIIYNPSTLEVHYKGPQYRRISLTIRQVLESRKKSTYGTSQVKKSNNITYTPTKSFSIRTAKEILQIGVPIANIRNFNIIAHIDHGKSTLADRFLEITNTLKQGQQQYLDKLKVEKERGITVKAQTATMFYEYKNEYYLLNLIDTPGHVDFHYEVSRSMVSCDGSLLLVDACQGIQAQTISNYELALLSNLKIIPVINKIDMPNSLTDEVTLQIMEQFGFQQSEIQCVSGKTGLNVQALLEYIINTVPPPQVNIEADFKGFLIDSWYTKDQGVVMLFQIKQGQIKKGDQILSCQYKKMYEVFDVGILNPEMISLDHIQAGQVGYVVTNMKSAKEARVGDTFHKFGQKVEPEQGFQEATPMVYAGIYPSDAEQYPELEKNIHRLQITDPAVLVQKESSSTLGNGFRCGFLGLLHMEVFKQRLDDEFQVEAFLTTPQVKYRIKVRGKKEPVDIDSVQQLPSSHEIVHYEEPIVEVTIIIPDEYTKEITNLCYERRGHQIIINFFDKLKSLTKGYGSMDYEQKGYQVADIRQLKILLMQDEIDTLSFLVHESNAIQMGRDIVTKLKELIPPQLFTVSIQAKLDSKIIVREDVKALRKNVTAKCYGGDYSRKKKLLEKQKEGKKRMRQLGRVDVPQDTFIQLFKK